MDGARGPGVDEERVVGVAVDVDEPGRDDVPGRVDLRRSDLRDLADRRDSTVLDRDIGSDGLGTGAVEHGAVPDHTVDHARFPP